MEFWLASELDVIFCHEMDTECLKELPFFSVSRKEWRSTEFWDGDGIHFVKLLLKNGCLKAYNSTSCHRHG
jgi:hypothetical protein